MIQTVLAREGPYPHHNVPDAWLLYNKVKNVKRGLFFQMGESWSKMRKALNKVMLEDPSSIMRFSGSLVNITTEYLDSLWNGGNGDQPVLIKDIKTSLCNWSIETTGFILFGRRMGCIGSAARHYDPRAEKLVRSVSNIFKETAKFQIIPPNIAHRIGLPVWQRFEKASDEMIAVANDYVQQFMGSARSDEAQPNGSVARDLINLNELSDDEISRSLVDLIIASAETTSILVQWILYLIAKHQDVQSKLLEEVRPLLDKDVSSIAWDRLGHQAPYLRAFIKEVSRLYPVAPFLARTLEQEIVLGGFKVPAGTPLALSLFTTSRMAEYFDDPLDLRPERWIRNKSEADSTYRNDKSHAYASLPFGHGRRRCIGSRAAELEMSIMVALFVNKFESALSDDMNNLGIKLRMTLGPDRPINLMIKKR